MGGPTVAPVGNGRGGAGPNDAGVLTKGVSTPRGTGVGCEYPRIMVLQEEEALRRDHFLFQEPDSTLLISGTAGSLQVGTGAAGMRVKWGPALPRPPRGGLGLLLFSHSAHLSLSVMRVVPLVSTRALRCIACGVGWWAAGGMHRDWPDARGIWHNRAKNCLALPPARPCVPASYVLESARSFRRRGWAGQSLGASRRHVIRSLLRAFGSAWAHMPISLLRARCARLFWARFVLGVLGESTAASIRRPTDGANSLPTRQVWANEEDHMRIISMQARPAQPPPHSHAGLFRRSRSCRR